MNTIVETLLKRASHAANTLETPAPDTAQLEEIISCALTAPDHGKIRPWQFTIIQDEGRQRLGRALANAALAADSSLDSEKLAAIGAKPLRAPMIIAITVKIVDDLPKVPPFEQILSTGAATQQMQLAANALGFGCVWVSGPYCNSEAIKKMLGAVESDLVAGFVYIGTPKKPAPEKKRPLVSEHIAYLT